ncbi:MAG: class I SAM-dependent methyltransferase [Betaproteobacteria bacterium]|nr:class I SAM-dependent methyltransferase [Betaproteobacteria bacterium]NBY05699.1 class I SAM-dependent methyltransferase [Betaproteobacteria bacterium]
MSGLLAWPIPALLIWSVTWLLYIFLSHTSLAMPWPGLIPVILGVFLSVLGSTRMRQALLALGFPLSWWLTSSVTLPAWFWLAPLFAALLVYPVHSWRDAPLFPTPLQALIKLPHKAPLKAGSIVFDAGCGLGDGLKALKLAYPMATFWGVDASWPLRWLAALRCPWARIWHGDIWTLSWRQCDMVYFFQRPESMPRAAQKAFDELKPGAWLVSLEFEAKDLIPTATIEASANRPIWMYQQPLKWVHQTHD